MTDFYNSILINDFCSEDAMQDDSVAIPLQKTREPILTECYFDFPKIKYGKSLGHGATGHVCEAMVPTMKNGIPSKPTKLAVKMTKTTHENKHFHRERLALQHLKALPSVLRLHGSEEANIVDGKSHNILYLEHCSRGEYFDVLEKFTYGLPEQLAIHFSKELWCALAQCHDAGVQHRDIKPENILVSSDYSIRLADFGSALTGYQSSSCEYCGTEQYIAPEVHHAALRSYNPEAADVWSMGVTIFITLFGIPPFFSATNKCWYFRCIRDGNWDRFWKQQEKARPDAPILSKLAKEFLQMALDPNPLTRPKACDMFEHEWLQNDHGVDIIVDDVEAFILANEMPPLDSVL